MCCYSDMLKANITDREGQCEEMKVFLVAIKGKCI